MTDQNETLSNQTTEILNLTENNFCSSQYLPEQEAAIKECEDRRRFEALKQLETDKRLESKGMDFHVISRYMFPGVIPEEVDRREKPLDQEEEEEPEPPRIAMSTI